MNPATQLISSGFERYLTEKSILKIICKLRIKEARKRHKVHMIRDVSLSNETLKDIRLLQANRDKKRILQILPPRKSWIRLKEKNRKKFSNSAELRFFELYTTVINIDRDIKNKVSNIEIFPWYIELQKFIKEVQGILNGQIPIRAPEIIPLLKDPIKKTCRPISKYRLEEHVAIGITGKYLTDCFDPIFLPCSYAFRSTNQSSVSKSHHEAIKKVLRFRNKFKGMPLWVAECDIRNFYDIISHKVIMETFEKHNARLKRKGIEVDHRACRLFDEYLSSYSYSKDVYPLNGSDHFHRFGIKGMYSLPDNELASFYDNISGERIGIPQGGAISCMISNLILHDIDFHLLEMKLQETIYLRFCDDMIILSKDENNCKKALEAYKLWMDRLKLVIHTPEKILAYDKKFWEVKSKEPYRWCIPNDAAVNVPWLSFVGYQIRYDGAIRVRKKSIEKQVAKQKEESRKVLKAISSNGKADLNTGSRKSSKQQQLALESRLIAMSVGRVKLHNFKNHIPGMCWTNGFRELKKNKVLDTQLRRLDQSRTKVLYNFKTSLRQLTKASENPDNKSAHRYFGAPFSYAYFLNTIKYIKNKGNVR